MKDPRAGIIRSLAIDRVTAEVFTALDARSIPALLLKGRGFVGLLYGDGAARTYNDADLLVRERDELAAGEVLTALGFTAAEGVGRPDPGIALQHVWRRDTTVVELHVKLTGVGAGPDAVWTAFADRPGSVRAGGREVPTPGRTAQLLHVALHAAQHGARVDKPQQDLRRAVETIEARDWAQAAALAAGLRAAPAFAAGLRLCAEGRELAERIGATDEPDRLTALRAASASPLAMGIGRLLEQETARSRLRAAGRALLPTPGFIRWWDPEARDGWRTLVRGYGRRYVHLARHGSAAVREQRRLTR